jgi:hypothetical protein
LILLLGVAVVAFGAALVSFEQDARAGCAAEVGRDPAYAVSLAGPATTGQTDYDLLVTRDGQPVSGASVCISTAMKGMSAMAVNDDAVETEPGRYRVSVRMEMAGSWEATVIVDEDGRPPAAVPLSFPVS